MSDSSHKGDITLTNTQFTVSNTPLERNLTSSDSEISISNSFYEGDKELLNSNLVVSNTALKGKILS